ncbi:glycoside hydrolase family 25 protein [Nocardia abscessus]|uniref:glycoside hydrolase family 25 protein n=1 Tax=Nocardia abscessus TaxID=120957 RepID=UPI0024574D7D|nr:glycoside hydrolase family 25 protein [Nocardia abscessus]
MTIFGIDVSSWQRGVDMRLVRAAGFEYVIAKASEGSTYINPEYRAQRDGARAAGLAFAAYHYVNSEAPAAWQVDCFERAEPDKAVPVMLDHEVGSGGVDVLRAVHAEFVRRGYRVVLLYLPRWYWSGHIGAPDLAGLPALMSSDYGPERAGLASVIYPGDTDRGWNGYGGRDVAVFQFTQKARVAGFSLDASAFRGTRAELDSLFSGTPNEGVAMSLSKADQEKILAGATQLTPWPPTPERPGLRKPFNAIYNVRDAISGGWAWLILADIWNEVVWDGYPDPVDELDGKAPDKVRRRSLVGYVLEVYKQTVLNGRKLDALIAAQGGAK